jgi:hypothetical protein
MSDWRDISTAPDDGEMILAFWAASGLMSIVYCSDEIEQHGFRFCLEDGAYVSTPTHWMPLPDPPVKP